ncbi:hypothetical protein LTR84_003906 [Exophiala bonariae]|uniref:SHSP domain-containing protein n=1 Tax=Exophiala bonariae TaxID=1690606 RepID=A0AAV9N7B0_9EURO|nr:hypothetical protein LTR84_003906 [Exophiala bonariae]
MALLPRLAHSFGGPTPHEFRPFLSLFNDTFNELQKISDTAGKTFAPKFDVRELEDRYLLEGELPGIAQKDIAIEFLDGQTLTIKGRTEHYRKEGPESSGGENGGVTQAASSDNAGTEGSSTKADSKQVAATNGGSQEVSKRDPKHTYWITERSVGEFARSFAFPNRVDQDQVKASLKDGILSVVVPKLQKNKETRKIQIE